VTSSRSKRLGTQFETAVVRYLSSFGLAVRRTPPSPADIGDIDGLDGYAIQCKNCQRLEIPHWIQQAKQQAQRAGKPHGVVVVKRRGKPIKDSFVIMDLETWVGTVTSAQAGEAGVCDSQAV
jgi:Holliday junction resolvase